MWICQEGEVEDEICERGRRTSVRVRRKKKVRSRSMKGGREQKTKEGKKKNMLGVSEPGGEG